jgi:hypothetical protein
MENAASASALLRAATERHAGANFIGGLCFIFNHDLLLKKYE